MHLVLEYVPDTVYRISKYYAKNNQRMPSLYVKLYTYQARLPRHCLLTLHTTAWLGLVHFGRRGLGNGRGS